MFKCHNCNSVFDEPMIYKECMGEYMGIPSYEIFEICPCCGDNDFDMEEEEEEDGCED